jgi:hypothetical protein
MQNKHEGDDMARSLIPGTLHVKDAYGREIFITKPAQNAIGEHRIAGWTMKITAFMADVGVTWAYVSRRGSHIEINLRV